MKKEIIAELARERETGITLPRTFCARLTMFTFSIKSGGRH